MLDKWFTKELANVLSDLLQISRTRPPMWISASFDWSFSEMSCTRVDVFSFPFIFQPRYLMLSGKDAISILIVSPVAREMGIYCWK